MYDLHWVLNLRAPIRSLNSTYKHCFGPPRRHKRQKPYNSRVSLAVTRSPGLHVLAWKLQQIVEALLLDVKGPLDHVNPSRLITRLIEFNLDGDLIRWVQSFLTNRWVQLQINNTQCRAQPINSGGPRGSPVSPFLFIIYLSGVFDVVESVSGVQSLSFSIPTSCFDGSKTSKIF